MAITLVGTSSGGISTGTASATASLPAGYAAGDTILAWFFNSAYTNTLSTSPSGYTRNADASGSDGTGTSSAKVDLFYKVATASEAAPGISYSGSSGRISWFIAVYRGVDTSNPFISGGTSSYTSGTTHVGPTVVNGVSSSAWAVLCNAGRGFSTAGASQSVAGLTEREDFDPGGTNTARMAGGLYDSNGPLGDTADKQYTVSLGLSSSNGVISTVILRPAATGGTAPTANFAADVTTGQVPFAVQFTDLSTGSPTSWAWDFGDGGTSTSQNPSHTYTVAGTYTVTLTATNGNGSDGETKTGYITVSTGYAGPRDLTVWPYAEDSPWNLPLATTATYATAGEATTSDLRTKGGTANINAGSWSHPIYYATDTDPLNSPTPTYAQRVPDQWWAGWETNDGSSVPLYTPAPFRIPAAATPALPDAAFPASDRHLHTIDPTRTFVDEMFNVVGTSPNRDCDFHARQKLSGSGVGNGGPRAYGGSAIAGLIRTADTTSEAIRHALAIALPGSALYEDGTGTNHGFVWPAIGQDGDAASTYTGTVPMGSLVAIPPSVDLGALGLSPAGLAVAQALQDFGGYVTDRSDNFTLYAEPALEGSSWLTAARADLATIRAQCVLVTNNSASTPGGGTFDGTATNRRALLADETDTQVAPVDAQITVYDALTSQVDPVCPRPSTGGALLEGDFLLFTLNLDDDVNITSIPSGAFEIIAPQKQNQDTNAVNFLVGAVYGKFVTAAEAASPPAGWTFGLNALSTDMQAATSRFRGVDPADPLAAVVGVEVYNSTGNDKTSPSITTDVANAYIITGTGHRSGSVTITAPANYTTVVDGSTLGGRSQAVAVRAASQGAAGATGTATWLFSSAAIGYAWTIALKPAEGGTEPPAATEVTPVDDAIATMSALAANAPIQAPTPTTGGALLEGDFLYFHLTWKTENVNFATSPSGSVALIPQRTMRHPTDATSWMHSAVYGYRVTAADVSSQPSSWTFTTDANPVDWNVHVVRFRGVHATDPLAGDFAATAEGIAAANVSTMDSPAVTTDVANAYVVVGTNVSSSSTVVTPPTGATWLSDGTGITTQVGGVAAKGTQAAVGSTGASTWNYSAARYGWAYTLALRPSAASQPGTAALVYRIVGDPRSDGFSVSTKTTGATSVRIKVATDSALTTGVAYSPSATPNSRGWAICSLSGLAENTGYYYAVEMTDGSGNVTLSAATTRTTPTLKTTGVAASTSFAWGSCLALGSTANTFSRALARNPKFFFPVGDFPYGDDPGGNSSSTDVALQVDTIEQMLAANSGLRDLMATSLTVAIKSDHDSGPNGGLPGAWTPANRAAHLEVFPTPPRPDPNCLYCSFVVGRVRFIFTDDRYPRTTTTYLGATQIAWFKNELLQPEPVKVWVQNLAYIDHSAAGNPATGNDTWADYPTDRNNIRDFINANKTAIGELVTVHGDQHCISGDTGVNNDWGGFPAYCAAPFDRTASRKGGPWSEGQYPATGTAVTQQYGFCTITDTGGSTITLDFKGYDQTDTARIPMTVTATVTAPSQTLTAAGPPSAPTQPGAGIAAGSRAFTAAPLTAPVQPGAGILPQPRTFSAASLGAPVQPGAGILPQPRTFSAAPLVAPTQSGASVVAGSRTLTAGSLTAPVQPGAGILPQPRAFSAAPLAAPVQPGTGLAAGARLLQVAGSAAPTQPGVTFSSGSVTLSVVMPTALVQPGAELKSGTGALGVAGPTVPAQPGAVVTPGSAALLVGPPLAPSQPGTIVTAPNSTIVPVLAPSAPAQPGLGGIALPPGAGVTAASPPVPTQPGATPLPGSKVLTLAAPLAPVQPGASTELWQTTVTASPPWPPSQPGARVLLANRPTTRQLGLATLAPWLPAQADLQPSTVGRATVDDGHLGAAQVVGVVAARSLLEGTFAARSAVKREAVAVSEIETPARARATMVSSSNARATVNRDGE